MNVSVFAYKAIGDEVAPIKDTDELIEGYCKGGANVLYERNVIGEHNTEFTNGHSRAITFLASLFEGTYEKKYQTEGCTVRNVNVTDPNGPVLSLG